MSWIIEDNILIYNSNVASELIASFDFDDTLVKFKSNKVLYNPNNKNIKDYKIVIFSNQLKGESDKIINRFNDFIKQINLDSVQIFISLKKDHYRKPNIGMWTLMEEKYNDNIKINNEKSFYVGDAGGRPNDFSCSDRKFAFNIGIKYYTPEEYFLSSKKTNDWSWNDISLSDYISNEIQEHPQILVNVNEMVILVGSPASGKSTFAKKFSNYEIINRDTLKTKAKCIKYTKMYLLSGKSVVIDNTNPSKINRKEYIDIANKLNIPIRCYYMDIPYELIKHINEYRINISKGQKVIPTVALNVYKKNFEQPSLDEGFSEIINIKFNPKFNNDEEMKMFYQKY